MKLALLNRKFSNEKKKKTKLTSYKDTVRRENIIKRAEYYVDEYSEVSDKFSNDERTGSEKQEMKNSQNM